MYKKILFKVSEENEEFKELIGTDVTFKSELISDSGLILHNKGEKAVITDILYKKGRWSNLCSDIYIEPQLHSFHINNEISHTYFPEIFEEFKINT